MFVERLLELNDEDYREIKYLLEVLHNRKVERSFKEIIISIINNMCYVVRNKEQKIIGMVLCSLASHLSDYRLIIDNVVVNPEYRRLGIGTLLIARCMGNADFFDVGSVELTVRSTNQAAINLYKKFGLETTNKIIMRKILKPWQDSQ